MITATNSMILLGGLVTPWLLGLGGILVAVPIIIHLLNKRKFKIVDWAAMEFLFDADKRNRRRVRLENLILLLLRCLAIFLIGLLLARPFISRGKIAGLLKSTQYSRVVLLDDSLSMTVQSGNESSIDRAKRSLIELANGLKENDSDDLLTVLLTSDPDEPLINAERVNEDTIQEILDSIERIEASDMTAEIPGALEHLEKYATTAGKNVNTVVYVFTDLRERDWTADSQSETDNSPAGILKRMGERARACFLVDVGSDEQQNLAITEIRPEQRLVAGVKSRFEVTVKNLGDQTVRDARVRFTVGDSLPQEEPLEAIEPGKTQTVSFNQTFRQEDFETESMGEALDESALARPPIKSYPIKAEIVADAAFDSDRLEADSRRHFAARVTGGNSVLVVDGAPSVVELASESIFLQRALRPFRDQWFGTVVNVINDAQLENAELDNFDVVILCNVFDLEEDTVQSLEKWVNKGGGLVVFPGDQVSEDRFNQSFFKDGKGLSPFQLVDVTGDELEQTWATLHVDGSYSLRVLSTNEAGELEPKATTVHIDGETNHPVFQQFHSSDNLLLGNVKIFRWFEAAMMEEQLGKSVRVYAALNAEDGQWPAVAEKRFGKGRVVAFTIPADKEWHNWSELPTWTILAHTLVEYLADRGATGGDVRVGQDLLLPVNLTEHKVDARLVMPDASELSVQAIPRQPQKGNEKADSNGGSDEGESPQDESQPMTVGEEDEAKKDVVYQVEYSGAERSGIYKLHLNRTGGGEDQMLFAVNVDADEGRLQRLDLETFSSQIEDENIKLINGDEAVSQAIQGAQIEIWPWVLLLVGIVLCAEQFLGWVFGMRR